MNSTALLRIASSCLAAGLLAVGLLATVQLSGSAPTRRESDAGEARPRSAAESSPSTAGRSSRDRASERDARRSSSEKAWADATVATDFLPPAPHVPAERSRFRPIAHRRTRPRDPETSLDPLYVPLSQRPVTFRAGADEQRRQRVDEAVHEAPAPPSDLEVRLAGLQRDVERLAQAQSRQQAEEVRQATDLLRQLQQNRQLDALQEQLRALQSGGGAGLAAPNAVPGEAESPPNAAPAAGIESDSDRSDSGRRPVMKAIPGGSDAETFSLQIEDADIREVLEMLGQLANLNVLVGEGVTGTVSTNLEEVTIEEALDALLKSRDYVYERDGKFLYVTTAEERRQRELRRRPLVTKVYRPNYISVADLQALVAPLMSETVGRIAVTAPNEVGIKSDAENAGGDQLVQGDALLVHDYADVIAEIDRVVLEMDVPPPQVVIEAMILSVSLTDDLRFGVNFALLSGDNRDLVVSGVGQTLGAASGFPGAANDVVTASGRFAANAAGLKYGWLRGDSAGFVEALETIADTNIVASPQLRVLNKQRAELIIGQRLSYTTTTFNGTQSIETVNFLDVGTKLVIRPFVADDGLVRMEIHPERSSATNNPDTNLPDVETTEVTSNVMVRDGATIVIGGLIEEASAEQRTRVPFLGAIPWIGKAFTNVDQIVDRNELIILITPRIVHEPADAVEGDVIRHENARRHEFFTENLSPFSRHNLARMHFERAEYRFERVELLRARLHVNEALRISPNDLKALQLRDLIEGAIEAKMPWNALREDPPLPLPVVDVPEDAEGPSFEPPTVVGEDEQEPPRWTARRSDDDENAR